MAKKIYKVTGNTYTTWEAPDDEVVSRPFTEIKPPVGKDIIIVGFDWIANKWQTVESIPVPEYKILTQAVAELGESVSNLKVTLSNLEERVKHLENLKAEENNG